MIEKTDRMSLLKQVQAADFAIVEVGLYLDTHPTNQKAMAYYKTWQSIRNKAVETYEKLYGPLTIFGNESPTEWKWISNPWPWEMED